jgi:polyhydroxyalkanoate synthesis repressor PhaR
MAQDKSTSPPRSTAKGANGKSAGGGAMDGPVTIKKYANRRLYNTATSSYVTLDHLSQMVRDGIEFSVFDAKSGEDITRSVLTQIIVEEEAKNGQNLLPIGFLRQLIAYYGDNMHRMMLPQYLDLSIRSFSENQEKMNEYMQGAFGSVFPFGGLEEMTKQNMAIFERTMQMFSPFGGGAASAPEEAEDDVTALRAQLEAARAEIEALKSNRT